MKNDLSLVDVRKCWWECLLSVCLLASASNGLAQTSPVGDWELYFSGAEKGVAQISFAPDFTLAGLQIHAPGKRKPSGEVDPRGVSDNGLDPRTGNNTVSTNTTLYGTSEINGTWGFDLKGRVVGVMTLTNLNYTNGISFTAKVTQGSKPRITIKAMEQPPGYSVYQGVPRAVLPDFSGDYFAIGKRGKDTYVEMTTLYPTIFPNYYLVDANGPGFAGTGFAMFTANKHVGVYYDYLEPGSTNLTDVIVVATTGTYKTNKLPIVSGTLSGTDGTANLSLKFGRR